MNERKRKSTVKCWRGYVLRTLIVLPFIGIALFAALLAAPFNLPDLLKRKKMMSVNK